jgi:hypothetical protein
MSDKWCQKSKQKLLKRCYNVLQYIDNQALAKRTSNLRTSYI